jgi:ubiquinone/menaquinone biosynthesis C-methylase UbiE
MEMMKMISKNTFNKKTEENYLYWQNDFDTHSSYMRADDGNEYDILRRLLLHFVKRCESFLDVGCAMGDTLEVSEKLGLQLNYCGTDYADKFIKANKKRRPEVTWRVRDARDLGGYDESWDTVCLYDVLDGLNGWEQALDEAYRVCKKRVIVLMWMDPHMEEKYEYMQKLGLKTLMIDIEGYGIHYHKILVGEK